MNIKQWQHNGKINEKEIRKILKVKEQELALKKYERYQLALDSVATLQKQIQKKYPEQNLIKIKDDQIQIGSAEMLTESQHQQLKQAIKAMMPWRKGPFDLFGQKIDAEWRSDLKWERVKKKIGSLQGKAVLDIGCNNGYYLYHMSKHKPKLLLGIDPVVPYHQQFQLINGFAPLPQTDFKLLGIQDLVHFEKVFDVIFCMGILYHHTDPIGLLRIILKALRPGGLLLVESEGINVPGSYCLLPQSRYTGMPGHWFIPTKEALENLIRRSGFQYVDTFDAIKLDSEEQRRTEFSPFESLADSLDVTDANLTAEGYPAPWRFYVKAHKARKR